MPSALRVFLGYALMIAATVAALFWLRGMGHGLVAPQPTADQVVFGPVSHGQQLDVLLHVLMALFVITLLARGLGKLFKTFHQPPVIGEIIAGIMLGPSLLGRVWPAATEFLLPPRVAPLLQILAQMGVILYMFIVGIELDPGLMRKKGHATIAISHASIVLPFVLGFGLALYLYPRLATSDVPFTPFALFLGVSMSVTAFPVLARILTDRKMARTRIGAIALTCAAVDDVTAWCLLALVTSVVTAKQGSGFFMAGMALAYVATMVLIVRPLMLRLARYTGNHGQLTQGTLAILLLALLLSALATDLIGIHALFGAFALGAAIPHDSLMAKQLMTKLEDLAVVLLLPAFFAFTGMRTQIGLVSGTEQWVICGLICIVASLGKFGGSTIAARLTGLPWRESSALGVLMNTRGLMELIVLNVGLELRVISPTLFAMLVIMALVTTFATTPLLRLILGKQAAIIDETETAVAPEKPTESSGVLVPIANPASMSTLVEVALAMKREADPEPRLVALVRRPNHALYPGRQRQPTEETPPESSVLAQALDYARERGGMLQGQAIWTDNPPSDILGMAADPEIRWVLLGFHRPVFGTDVTGGVVRAVFDRAREANVNAAVVVHTHDATLTQLVVVIDEGSDSRAALELACRLARREGQSLRLVMLPKSGTEPELGLQAMVKEASRAASRWLSTQAVDRKDKSWHGLLTSADAVIVGSALVTELDLPLTVGTLADRLLIVVRGGAKPRPVDEAAAAVAGVAAD